MYLLFLYYEVLINQRVFKKQVNYAVSNLTLRHYYKRATASYLLDIISEGPSHIVKAT